MRTIELKNGDIEYVKDSVYGMIDLIKEKFSDEIGKILFNEFSNIIEEKDYAELQYETINRDSQYKINELEDEIARLERENRRLEDKVNN